MATHFEKKRFNKKVIVRTLFHGFNPQDYFYRNTGMLSPVWCLGQTWATTHLAKVAIKLGQEELANISCNRSNGRVVFRLISHSRPKKELGLGEQGRVTPRRLKGFQDHHPESMQRRYEIMDAVRAEADLAGFNAIATPALEYSEVLLGVGGETDKQVFRFQDNGQRDVALRFDLTVPFARYVAEHQGKLTFPFKRMQIGDVWRAEKPQKGRYREFCQCDLDIIGVNSQEADTEILYSFSRILDRLNCGRYTMSIGSRPVLSGLIAKTLGVLNGSELNLTLIAIDKLDKIGAEKVAISLSQIDNVSLDAAKQLLDILSKKNHSGATCLDAIEGLFVGDAPLLAELSQLKETVETLQALSQNGSGDFILDLSIARGLGYYTGIVFETQLNEQTEFGSICSGGRYNQLVERYQNRELPGIGGSIGLDRLLAALDQQEQDPHQSGEKSVFVTIASSGARKEAFTLLAELRDAGITANIALNTKKLSNQFKYADKLGFPLVLTLGEDEIREQTVTLKNMRTGEENRAVPRSKALSVVKEFLSQQ